LAASIAAATVTGAGRAETLRVPCSAWAESALEAPGGRAKDFAPQGGSIRFGAWHPNHKLPGSGVRFGYLQFVIPEELAEKAIRRATLHAHCLRFSNPEYPANANFSYVPDDSWAAPAGAPSPRRVPKLICTGQREIASRNGQRGRSGDR